MRVKLLLCLVYDLCRHAVKDYKEDTDKFRKKVGISPTEFRGNPFCMPIFMLNFAA